MEITRQQFLKSFAGFAGLIGFSGVFASLPLTALGASKRKAPSIKEKLVYNNPFHQKIKKAWYKGRKISHLSLGATTTRPPFKIAEQYNIIYEDQYKGPTTTVEAFEEQEEATVGTGIFDSAPGDNNYSPIWHINWVLAPRTYKADSVRSAEEVKKLGYRIVDSNIWEN